MGEQRRPPWRRPALWVFVVLVAICLARVVWVSSQGANPLADGLGIVAIGLGGALVLAGASWWLLRRMQLRTREELEELYPGMLRFAALIGDRHRAARRARAERLGEPDDLPKNMSLLEVLVDEVGVRLVGNGWTSTLMLAADEITGIGQGVETSGLQEHEALTLRLDVIGRVIDLPLVPLRDSALSPMRPDEVRGLVERLREVLGPGVRDDRHG